MKYMADWVQNVCSYLFNVLKKFIIIKVFEYL
jgi:hypothetical protein